jgi:hypothetical protein
MIMDDKGLDETLPLTLDNLCFLPTRIYTILNRNTILKALNVAKAVLLSLIANVDSFMKFAEFFRHRCKQVKTTRRQKASVDGQNIFYEWISFALLPCFF